MYALVVVGWIPSERIQRETKTPLAECTRSTGGSFFLHAYRNTNARFAAPFDQNGYLYQRP